MITNIKDFKLLGCCKHFALTYYAQVTVTERGFLKSTTTTLPIHSPGYSGKWFWSDNDLLTNKPCPHTVNLLADDYREENAELWAAIERRNVKCQSNPQITSLLAAEKDFKAGRQSRPL
jgi:hypothetical protein